MSKKSLNEDFLRALGASKKRKGPRISGEALGALGVHKTRLKRPVDVSAKKIAENIRSGTRAINDFRAAGGDAGDKQTTLSDLLANLMHYANHRKGVDFDEALHEAQGHYDYETGRRK